MLKVKLINLFDTHMSIHVWIADNMFSNLNIWMQVYIETWFILVFDA